MDIAALGLRVDSGSAKAATSDLKQLTTAADGAEAAVAGLGSASTTAGKGVRESGRAAKEAAQGVSQIGTAAKSVASSLGQLANSHRSFEQLRASVDPAYASMQRYSQVQRELAAMVDAGEASQRAANIVLEQAARQYMGVATAAERAEQAAREMAAAKAAEEAATRQATAETERTTAAYRAMLASVDPMSGSLMRMAAAVKAADRAMDAGVISAMEHTRALHLAKVQHEEFARSAAAAGSGLGRFGPQLTNAGFQIQDFAIQVASGQSAMVAFAQQAPQLLGVLGFSGKLALIGAGLGTILAVGMAVAPMLMSMGEKAKTAEEKLSDLTSAVSLYREMADLSNRTTAELRDEFGSLGDDASAAAQFIGEIAQVDALNKANAAIKELSETYGGFSRDLRDQQMLPGANAFSLMATGWDKTFVDEYDATIRKLKDTFAITSEDANRLAEALAGLDADTPQAQLEAATKLHATFKEMYGSLVNVPPQLLDIAKQVGLIAIEGGKIVDPLVAANQRGMELKQTANEMILSYQRQGEMAQAVARYGADSAQVEALKREEAERTVNAILEQANIGGIVAGRIRDAALQTFDLQSAASAAAGALADADAAARSLAAAIAAAAGFSANLDNGVVVLEAKLNALRAGANAANAATIAGMKLEAQAMRDKAVAAGESIITANARLAIDKSQIATQETLLGQIEAQADANKAAEKAASSGAKSRASEAKKLETSLQNEQERWEDLLDPMARYNRELKALQAVQSRLKPETFAKAQEYLKDQLAESVPLVNDLSNAWADFVMSGGQSLSSLGDLFKNLLRQMIVDAAKNKIMLWLDVGGAASGKPGATGASGGTSGAAGGLSGLSGLLGPDSWLGGKLSSGKGFLGGIGNLLGMGGTGAAAGGGLSGIAGMLGTAGAIIGGIGAVLSIGKALFGRTLKDTGVMGSFTGDDFSGQSYKFYKGGMLRSDKTKTEALDSGTSAVIGEAYKTMRENIRDMSSVLGLGSSAIEDFAHDFKISTKDMTEDQIVQALQDEMEKAGAGMAGLVLGTERYTKAGESALDTMTRLSTSLEGMRDVADLLGHRFTWAGLRGADLASGIVDAFGGLDEMGSAVQSYWQTFYGENARLRTVTRQTSEALADMGAAMPRTRDEYRRMIEAIDLSDRSTHELYATLIGLSDVMDQILPAADGLTRQLERMQNRLVVQLGQISDGLTEAIKANRAAAGDWTKAGGTIREYLDKLRGTASALVSPQSAQAYNRVQYLSTLRDARGGNAEAAQELTGRAQSYLTSVNANAGTQFEAARAQARVMAQIGGVATTSDRYAAALDRAATLQERQLGAIERLQEFIANGGTLTAERLTAVRERIATLDASISTVARRNADLTIAGFNDALSEAPVQIEGGMELREAMGGLRGSLRDLRQAVVAETERQERESRVSALNRFVAGLTVNGQGNAFVNDTDLSSMAQIAGISTEGLSTTQIRRRLANFSDTDKLTGTVYDPTGSKEAAYIDRTTAKPESTIADPLMGYRLGYAWRGSQSGEWHQIVHGPLGGSRSFVVPGVANRDEWLKSMVDSKKLPAFANGGTHMGGPAYIGEDDLELVAPSRVYSPSETRDMLDNRLLVAEVKALRADLATYHNEDRQLGMGTESNTRKIVNRLDRAFADGLPVVEVTP